MGQNGVYVNWLPLFFLNEFQLDIRRSALYVSAVFCAGVGGNIVGGDAGDRILQKDM